VRRDNTAAVATESIDSIEEITRLVESGHADAGPRLKQALSRWPDSQRLCMLSADWHQQNGRDDEAIKVLATAFKAHPEKQAIGMRLLMLHHGRGDLAQAGEVLAGLQTRFKRSSKMAQWAARLAMSGDQPAQARQHLGKALDYARDEESAAAVLKEAVRLGFDGKHNWSLAQQAAAAWPDSSEVLIAAATAAITAGQEEAAAAFLKKLERCDDRDSDWRATLGQALLDAGMFDQAYRVLQADGDTSDFSLTQLSAAIQAAIRVGQREVACTLAEQVLHHPDADGNDKRIAFGALLAIREFDRATAILEDLPREDSSLVRMLSQRVSAVRRFDMDPAVAATLDDGRREVHCEFVDGADTTLLVFTGLEQKSAVPVSTIHTLLAPLGANIIYLRDRQRLGGINGFETLAGNYAGSVAALKKMVPGSSKRLLCFGMSAGGYSALRYGLDMGAEKVLCMGSPTDVSAAAAEADGRAKAVWRRLNKVAPEMARDMRAIYAANEKRPRVELWYGSEMPQDRMHAEHMRGLEGVMVRAIPKCDRHGVLWHLIGEQRAEGIFENFLSR
jgi:Flp pilus assembly protein TadD